VPHVRWAILCIGCAVLLVACRSAKVPHEHIRKGDEIIVCGQRVQTGAPVVLWTDPGGYNGYMAPPGTRWNDRPGAPSAAATLAQLQQVIDQFVIHYDACGLSRECFRILNERNLSVHFMLDLDGTIYQTLDLKERAWHATTSNSRSIGIEIANVGAFDSPRSPLLTRWYAPDAEGRTRITIPRELGDGGLRSRGFVPRPARAEPVSGQVQSMTLHQYDLTEEQYDSLMKLTGALCRVFPKIRCDYPRDAAGNLITHKLPDDHLSVYRGLIGHYHVQANKQDPGPAFQWDRIIAGARQLLSR
jgi:N-acetyl-anhydromuramyl-L-alanine amidase AmpD